MKIRMKNSYGLACVASFRAGEEVDVIAIEDNGWAKFKKRNRGGYIPPMAFEIIPDTPERTYTEAEMKAIRSEWQDKYFKLEDEVERWKEGHDYLERELSARKAKLDLLEPEIKRIEAAVNRVIPEDKEGYLAEHFENLIDELEFWRSNYGGGKDFVKAHEIGPVFASTEDNHPEDQFTNKEAIIDFYRVTERQQTIKIKNLEKENKSLQRKLDEIEVLLDGEVPEKEGDIVELFEALIKELHERRSIKDLNAFFTLVRDQKVEEFKSRWLSESELNPPKAESIFGNAYIDLDKMNKQNPFQVRKVRAIR